MSDDGHFTGPWHSVGSEVFSADGRRVCHTPGSKRFPSESPEAIANARLIAAAPTMYEYIESSASAGCATAKKIMEQINGHP